MGSDPSITVLMSVYNGEKYLREAIDSILGQTFSDFEFLIYDDCSTDSTSQIIMSYNDARIKYRRNEANQGLTKNLNAGVTRARGEYIARMDADDIAKPDRLLLQKHWLDENPEVAILGTPVSYFNSELGDLGDSREPETDSEIKALLLVSFTLMHPTIMIRRQALQDHGINYNPDFRCSQDHALYFDCIKAGLRFANYPEALLRMRSHAASISRSKNGLQRECSNRARRLFLETTGGARGIEKREMDVYGLISSGGFPDDIEGIHDYESFVEQILSRDAVMHYFDRSVLRRVMANRLLSLAYGNASRRGVRSSVLAAKKSSLTSYADPWSMKKNFKFWMKVLLAR